MSDYEGRNPWNHTWLWYGWKAWLQAAEQFLKIHHLGFTHKVYSGDCLVFCFVLEYFSAGSSVLFQSTSKL